MKRALRVILALIVLAVIGGAVFWVLTIPQTVDAATLPPRTADLANGEVTFNIGGCPACHTGRDGERLHLAGGGRLKSPFGDFYVPNISSDPEDGIGAWTEAQFVTAMTKGVGVRGEHLYPAFPYTSYTHVRLDDVRDLFAYLKTLPPMKGKVRDHDLPFPFNIRRGLGLWKILYLNSQQFTPNPSKPVAWNRGAYLVNGPGHCAECHSPRSLIGGITASRRFAGGPNPEGEGFIPNITQGKLGDWTEDDFATLLETGETPEPNSVSGSMRAVVQNTSKLSAQDRAAMATYLKTLHPGSGADLTHPD